MEKEIRTFNSNFQIRHIDEKYIVEGYAAIYNSLSLNLGGFVEVIAQGAFTDDLINSSDVFCLLNHRDDRGILARSKEGKGTLKLTADDVGLKYEFELPDSPLGQELREYINRKEITSSSFAFTIENDVWEDYDTETKKRTILKIHRLYDVSPVFNPAYTDTSVGKRSLDEYIKAEQRKLDEAKETREKELEKYFVQLEQRYNKLTNKQNN